MKKFTYLLAGLLSFSVLAGDKDKEALADVKISNKIQFVEVTDQDFSPGNGLLAATSVKQIKREKSQLDQVNQSNRRFVYLTNTNTTKAIQGVLSARMPTGSKKRNAAKFFVKPGATVYLGHFDKNLSFKPYKASYVSDEELVAMNKKESK